MKILFIGDVVGEPGCHCLQNLLPSLKAELGADMCIANGENSAKGNGITADSADWMHSCGVDVITTGNHLFKKFEAKKLLQQNDRVVRPYNYKHAPGDGYFIYDSVRGRVGVISLMGTALMNPLPNPFECMDELLPKLQEDCDFVFLDFHAETTSEKGAMAHYLDGRVGAVIGTHTHVQTADERVLPGGTAFLTDAGMTGPEDAVLGVDKQVIIDRFLTFLPSQFTVPDSPCILNGALIETDGPRAKSIMRVQRRED